MTPRMWLAVAFLGLVGTPVALFVWLLNGITQGIARINPDHLADEVASWSRYTEEP